MSLSESFFAEFGRRPNPGDVIESEETLYTFTGREWDMLCPVESDDPNSITFQMGSGVEVTAPLETVLLVILRTMCALRKDVATEASKVLLEAFRTAGWREPTMKGVPGKFTADLQGEELSWNLTDVGPVLEALRSGRPNCVFHENEKCLRFVNLEGVLSARIEFEPEEKKIVKEASVEPSQD